MKQIRPKEHVASFSLCRVVVSFRHSSHLLSSSHWLFQQRRSWSFHQKQKEGKKGELGKGVTK